MEKECKELETKIKDALDYTKSLIKKAEGDDGLTTQLEYCKRGLLDASYDIEYIVKYLI